MKRRFIMLLCTVITALMLCVLFLVGCFRNNNTEPKEYLIQYTDESGTHELNVTEGMQYSLDIIPTKKGYTFIGLYDDELAGIQYVTASGKSVNAFADGKNIVLYPHFRANEYNFLLDYQGATVNGIRQLKAEYGSLLPELPYNLVKEHHEFLGWYTQSGCLGIKVADSSGLIASAAVVNENNFILNEEGENIILYAGFKEVEYTLTFYSQDGLTVLKTAKVKNGDELSQFVSGITTPDGYKVLDWSDEKGEAIIIGKVTGDLNLYVKSYAVNLTFDSDGGNKIDMIEVKAGSSVALPVPQKEYYKFIGWSVNGVKIEKDYIAPVKNTVLTALWEQTHFTITFDTDGGNAINKQIIKMGESVTLPIANRQYYAFIGWINNGDTVETVFVMPAENVTLRARWEKTHYELKFNTDGGKAISPLMVKDGEQPVLPNPIKEGFAFIEWTYNGNQISQSFTMPQKDIVIKAVWQRTHYKVMYDSDGGTNIRYVLVKIGETLTALPQAERIGYIFKGWKDTTGNVYTDGITPVNDITLKADWEARKFEINFEPQNGTVSVEKGTVIYGQNFIFPIPVRGEDVFSGWFTAVTGGVKLTDDKGNSVAQWSYTEDKTVYAQWVR